MRSSRLGALALFFFSSAFFTLAGCGGGGGSGGGNAPPPPTSPVTFKVGVTVSGLLGELKILLNGGGRLTLSQDGAAQFTTELTNGASYNVTIDTQPQGQECAVANAAGSINNADQTVAITCVLSPKPSISFVWPSPLVVGQEARISGSNLDQATITLDGVALAAVSQSTHELRFVVPQKAVGSYLLQLINNDGVAQTTVGLKDVMRDVVAIDSGNAHSCAVINGGAVQCWGNNQYGQVDNSTFTFVENPHLVSNIAGAAQVATGTGHSCARLTSGEVWCWGNNRKGQLGNANLATKILPAAVADLGTASYVSAGDNHSCAVVDGGAVKCWGDNRYGQLGDGGTTDSSSPVTVIGITNAVSVSSGYRHSCARLSTGAVQCWGRNTEGQLGNGPATGNSTTPVTVSTITNAVALDVGESYSCVVLADGTVACWGTGATGELGNGTTAMSLVPVSVSGITNAVAVSVGNSFDKTSNTTVDSIYKHACALLSDGAVRCWGGNDSGQLGIGSLVQQSNTPVNVSVSGTRHC